MHMVVAAVKSSIYFCAMYNSFKTGQSNGDMSYANIEFSNIGISKKIVLFLFSGVVQLIGHRTPNRTNLKRNESKINIMDFSYVCKY